MYFEIIEEEFVGSLRVSLIRRQGLRRFEGDPTSYVLEIMRPDAVLTPEAQSAARAECMEIMRLVRDALVKRGRKDRKHNPRALEPYERTVSDWVSEDGDVNGDGVQDD